MSKIALSGNASGTGTFTFASPNSNTDRTLTLPDATGTINTSGAVNEVPAGSASAPSIYPTGDTNTGIFFPAADTIGFAEGGAEAMRVDSTGRLLVGTSTGPSSSVAQGDQARLHVQGRPGNATSFAAINLARNEATPAADNVLGYLNFTDSAGDVYASISGWVDAAPGSGDYPGRIVFETIPNGSSTRTERARITSGGEFYVAGTTDQGAYNIQCNGTGVWGAGAYVNGSDERIKEDIAPITSSLNVVEKLNPVTYRYKEHWSKDQSVQTGFIAQELLVALEDQNYVEGVVQQGGSEGYYSVAYQNIIPILTKAIQELKAINDAQASRIETLEAKVAALEAQE